MEGFSFCEGPLPEDVSWALEPSLFNRMAHIRLQQETGWRSFLIRSEQGGIEGLVHFHVVNDMARSPLRSPYGSYEFSQRVPPEVLFSFMSFVEDKLEAGSVGTIRIKCPPALYFPYQTALTQTLLVNRGYKVIRAEAGAMISLRGEWEIDAWEQRKLRQARDAGLHISTFPQNELSGAYNFIAACRRERDQDISMSLEELQQVADAFPGNVHLHVVRQGDQLAAASIGIVVSSKIVYNFLSAHGRSYDHLSPVVLLLDRMCHRYKEEGYDWLDLGTSALPGGPNFPLLRFKLRAGAQPTPKFTFEKRLFGTDAPH